MRRVADRTGVAAMFTTWAPYALVGVLLGVLVFGDRIQVSTGGAGTLTVTARA